MLCRGFVAPQVASRKQIAFFRVRVKKVRHIYDRYEQRSSDSRKPGPLLFQTSSIHIYLRPTRLIFSCICMALVKHFRKVNKFLFCFDLNKMQKGGFFQSELSNGTDA